ncbi:hypothetical protein AAV35_011115 [Salimicrobium jeotgali]|uniref:Glutamate-rich protein GrpB n=1 Tax=Salimicrobium jeotgali TaxID=1230341 RepID=K2GDH7_9BACI|nr:GrpB family protein [Salimicrobium jeotgali]AKG05276.1 hypothetical protein AAV35_011115 [Salimicrobium jeotgali]EKE32332.1 hypothetical protein MJ3_02797 [Salimicrobium jeotgali]MBM7695695.1 GrpB-like predicted nucleotidyltransferase (UPF0157 family) [Salimicrobium jeotgali]
MRVEVRRYEGRWKELFEEEARRIEAIFGEELFNIHHIGSTSVFGLKAKPIIDIMPVVGNIEKVAIFNEQMERIGYEPMGEFGIEGRRYFRKGREHRTHQVHIFQADNEQDIKRHLAVRDYLCAHKEEAERYGDLKERLAKKFPENISGYADGKDKFVKELERKALRWYGNIR